MNERNWKTCFYLVYVLNIKCIIDMWRQQNPPEAWMNEFKPNPRTRVLACPYIFLSSVLELTIVSLYFISALFGIFNVRKMENAIEMSLLVMWLILVIAAMMQSIMDDFDDLYPIEGTPAYLKWRHRAKELWGAVLFKHYSFAIIITVVLFIVVIVSLIVFEVYEDCLRCLRWLRTRPFFHSQQSREPLFNANVIPVSTTTQYGTSS